MQQHEHMLIIDCMRTRITPERQREIALLLDQPLDWQYIMQLLNHNRVASLFAYNIRNFPQIAGIPISKYLENQLAQTTMHNLRLKSELQRIIQHFNELGIHAITFKGPTLAEAIYGNLALRNIIDLDLLVDQQQFEQASAALATLGYEVIINPDDPLDTEQAETYHTKFFHPEMNVKVELHWHLVEIWRSVLDDSPTFWEFVVPMQFDGLENEVFCKEFLFVYLCVHGYRHYWQRLKWLVDIAELVDNHTDLNWSTIDALARRYGLVDIVDIALLLARNTLGANIPAEAALRIDAKPKLLRFTSYIWQVQFPTNADLAANELSPSRRFMFEYSLVENAHKRRLILHQIARMLFAPGRWQPNQADRDWIRLPESLTGLYYVLRPLRLIRAYGREQIKVIRSIVLRR